MKEVLKPEAVVTNAFPCSQLTALLPALVPRKEIPISPSFHPSHA